MKTKKMVFLLAFLFGCLFISSCSNDDEDNHEGEDNSIVGVWRSEESFQDVTFSDFYVFTKNYTGKKYSFVQASDGVFMDWYDEFTYQFEDKNLIFYFNESGRDVYSFTLTSKKLDLYDYDEEHYAYTRSNQAALNNMINKAKTVEFN